MPGGKGRESENPPTRLCSSKELQLPPWPHRSPAYPAALHPSEFSAQFCNLKPSLVPAGAPTCSIQHLVLRPPSEHAPRVKLGGCQDIADQGPLSEYADTMDAGEQRDLAQLFI